MTVSFIVFILTVLLYFPLKLIAPHVKLMDIPDEKLKTHKNPIPYIGGLMVYTGFILGIFFEIFILKIPYNSLYKGIIISGLFVLFLGIIDDIYRLDWFVKFIGEIILSIILISYNIHISFVFLPEWLNIILTVIWFVFIVNAYNLIDVSDGVSGFILTLFLVFSLILSIYTQNTVALVLIYPLLGSVLAFLVFNLPPAKIFAGDGGALFFGFMVGVISIMISYSRFNFFGILSPFMFNFYVIFEVALIIISRLQRGLSPFLGSPHHFPIRLKNKGISSSSALVIIVLIQTFFSILGLISVFSKRTFSLFTFIISVIIGTVFLMIALKTGNKNE